MNVDITPDPDGVGCVVTVTGDLNVEDYQQLFENAWSNRSYVTAKTAIWDFTGCQTRFRFGESRALARAASSGGSKPSRAQIASTAARKLAQFSMDNRPRQLPSRIAIVVASDLDYGMMRVYAGFTTLDSDEAQVFRSIEDATQWLMRSD